MLKRLSLICTAVSLCYVSSAFAETSAENKAAARDLALSGIALAQEGRCEEAIAPLSRAEELFHAPTILTWIGQCQIQMGQLVVGTETLRQVTRESLEKDAPAAYLDAQKKAAQLVAEYSPKIAKLTIEVRGSDAAVVTSSLVVQVDDMTVSEALIGAPRPTDPGTHVVSVEAPGYEPYQKTVELNPGQNEVLEIVLQVAEGGDQTGSSPSTTEQEPASAKTRNIVGWSLLGGGAAVMAGGGVLGILALSNKNGLDCQEKLCPKDQSDDLSRTRSQAAVSTVLFGVGGALAVGGLVVLLTGPKKNKDTADLGWELPRRGQTSVTVQPLVGWASVGVSGNF